jgi:DNA-binding CsgD family transcriptional regulator
MLLIPFSVMKRGIRRKGFEPLFIEVIFNQTNRNEQTCSFLPLLIILAALRDSLSNPGTPLLRALDVLEKRPKAPKNNYKYDTAGDIIAQTGAADPSSVRLKVRENHRLSAREIDRLVQTYKAGGVSQRELARQFHISLETANRHIRRRRQALKLGIVATCRPFK